MCLEVASHGGNPNKQIHEINSPALEGICMFEWSGLSDSTTFFAHSYVYTGICVRIIFLFVFLFAVRVRVRSGVDSSCSLCNFYLAQWTIERCIVYDFHLRCSRTAFTHTVHIKIDEMNNRCRFSSSQRTSIVFRMMRQEKCHGEKQ